MRAMLEFLAGIGGREEGVGSEVVPRDLLHLALTRPRLAGVICAAVENPRFTEKVCQ